MLIVERIKFMLTSNPSNGRGCGTRRAGSYLCTGTEIGGQPVEHFVIDPVKPWPGEWFRGYKILTGNNGVNHVFMTVGEIHYPSPWCFIEECRRYGVSRRIDDSFPFDKLTSGESRMYFLHPKSIPHFDYTVKREAPLEFCSFENTGGFIQPGWHNRTDWDERDPCAYALRDLSYLLHTKIAEEGVLQVKMPSFSYGVIPPVYPMISEYEDDWGLGIFFSTIITHVETPFKERPSVAISAKKSAYETVVTEY